MTHLGSETISVIYLGDDTVSKMYLGDALVYETGPSGYSFTMTAGEYPAFVVGYYPAIAIGSINSEPLPGETLVILVSGALNQVAFEGDVTALLAGLVVWVNGVAYPFDGPDWAYDAVNGVTTGTWAVAGPTFVENGVYFVEIK